MDVDQLIEALSLEEKVALLAGADVWSTATIDRLAIPSVTFSDGPHGVRGTKFFNGKPACLLPSATAMGATFDSELLESVGRLLGSEARSRNIQGLLAPTVCIQRSPLIGRGFEAFAEDPLLSGLLASAYINGVQKQGVGCILKHYAAHDQSSMSIEDSIRVSDRTLREVHLLPFQIAVKKSNPWGIMAAYQKVNGFHASEHDCLLQQVLRKEWGWNGLTMSDWFGTYSTSEAVNAGLDLEMPGPTKWRGDRLSWAVLSRKVSTSTLDERVKNVLEYVKRAVNTDIPRDASVTDEIATSMPVARKVSADSIVLLKNEEQILPLTNTKGKRFGLIGSGFHYPAIAGGGSADLTPYYVSTPYDAMVEEVGEENITYEVGCYTHRFSPLLSQDLYLPDSHETGLLCEWFSEDPTIQSCSVLTSVTTKQSGMFFSDNFPKDFPSLWWLKIRTTYKAKKSMTFRFGLCVGGLAKMSVNGTQVIDLWTSQPEKTDDTPFFNSMSMEKFADIDVEEGQQYNIEILMKNEAYGVSVGATPAGGIRLGGCEVFDEAEAMNRAINVAKTVDIPIVIAGTGSDWEYEAADRPSLDLPGRANDLVQAVLSANPNTIVITQSGLPITMPWINEARTLVHAWFGGQETGHAMTDVLFGRINPSGRLPITFPVRMEDNPAYLTFGKSDCELYYGEGVFVGYRYYEKLDRPPLFYFGFGLSYTEFEYTNLNVPLEYEPNPDFVMTVSVDVQNVGLSDGAEVVQIYVSDEKSSVIRPKKELKAYRKVSLPAGRKLSVELHIDKYAVSFWCERTSEWIAEAGRFDVIIGRSADPRDEIHRSSFDLSKTFRWSGI
ncbi:glycoside hydrolase family 3 protein [Aaosphaeria arxii CBS 175.79]|uniref:beta-glucosidase n=1 Tax=Aaosphaeria arxii CBS 175.79 TaxID=1450172 RepID=A0A6A5XYH0_9PLEO|nr:glycoside hydrolase family 3 protein [Aaosphaeria arxii CBS 175.79]KAF2017999.1 glycoside hydrolase family 3 protein [Aaosphaeria arxii CBS 175.79]